MLIQHGADVNKGLELVGLTVSPLHHLIRQNPMDINLIEMLIQNGADVNQELSFLCQQKVINYEGIKFIRFCSDDRSYTQQ